MREEWAVVNTAIGYSMNDPDVVYQLNERRDVLLRLCVAWDPAVKIIPIEADLPWGPNLAELADTRHFEYNESVNLQIIIEKQQPEDFDMREIGEDMEDGEEDYLEERMEADLGDETEAGLIDEIESMF